MNTLCSVPWQLQVLSFLFVSWPQEKMSLMSTFLEFWGWQELGSPCGSAPAGISHFKQGVQECPCCSFSGGPLAPRKPKVPKLDFSADFPVHACFGIIIIIIILLVRILWGEKASAAIIKRGTLALDK